MKLKEFWETMSKEVNDLDETIYLDNAATTFPKSEAVYVAMDNVNRNCCVNAGRGSYRMARTANEIIDDVKKRMKQLVKAPSTAGVVLSPSITVALNQILKGIDFKQNDIVYISPYEHNAVARTLKKIADLKKIAIKLMPTDKQSQEIDLNLLRDLMIQDNPKCVCCTHVSNVTGYILPIKEIFTIAKEIGAITILDSAQSLGLIDVTMDSIDFLAFAGHKTLYGPFGIGGFIDNSNIKLEQFIVGGTGSNSLVLDMPEESPNRYEAASSNIVAIAGLQAALKELDVNDNFRKEKELTEYARERIGDVYRVKLYVPENADNHIAIISFNLMIPDNSAANVGAALDEDYGIAVRTGYHCAPYVHDLIMDKEYNGTVRVGLGKFNTREDIDALCDALEEMV